MARSNSNWSTQTNRLEGNKSTKGIGDLAAGRLVEGLKYIDGFCGHYIGQQEFCCPCVDTVAASAICGGSPVRWRTKTSPTLSKMRFGTPEVPHVMYQSSPTDQGRLAGIEAKGRCCGGHQPGDPPRVADRIRRLNVAEIGNRLQGGVEFAVRQPVAQSWLGAYDRLPPDNRVELFEKILGEFRKDLDKVRVKLAPRRSRATATAASTPADAWNTSTTSARITKREVIRI